MAEIYRAEDFTEDGECHGLRCPGCGQDFVEGQPISERPYAMDEFAGEAMVCVELVCVACSVGGGAR